MFWFYNMKKKNHQVKKNPANNRSCLPNSILEQNNISVSLFLIYTVINTCLTRIQKNIHSLVFNVVFHFIVKGEMEKYQGEFLHCESALSTVPHTLLCVVDFLTHTRSLLT